MGPLNDCAPSGVWHTFHMRCFWVTAMAVSPTLMLVACSGGGAGITTAGSYNPGYGPFDRSGNYVDSWADKPAEKHSWADRPATAPAASTSGTGAVASSSQPKPTAAASSSTRSRPATSPTQVASVGRPPPRATAPSRSPAPAATTAPGPTPAPKPTTVKPKSPPPIRHTVKTGDTLYSLSRKYGTSVSAIQRANGIKGTTIITGKTYLIPR